jgi:hypothetical protein
MYFLPEAFLTRWIGKPRPVTVLPCRRSLRLLRALGAGLAPPGSVAPAMLLKQPSARLLPTMSCPAVPPRPTTAVPVCRTPQWPVVARSFPRPSRTQAATAF